MGCIIKILECGCVYRCATWGDVAGGLDIWLHCGKCSVWWSALAFDALDNDTQQYTIAALIDDFGWQISRQKAHDIWGENMKLAQESGRIIGDIVHDMLRRKQENIEGRQD